MAGTRPHSHNVGWHEPKASTDTAPVRSGATTTCFTLRLAPLTLTQVPASAALALGGTGDAWAAVAKPPTTTATAAAPAVVRMARPRARRRRGGSADRSWFIASP